jgi:hypothetical protein
VSKKKVFKSLLRQCFGPVTMVRQSLGTNIGKSVVEQHRIWRETSYVDVNEIVQKRATYNLHAACIKNGKTENDVRVSYRNVRITIAFLWVPVLYCAIQLATGSENLVSAALLIVGVSSAVVSLLAATHHQVTIREKAFLSPMEFGAYVSAYPAVLLPIPLAKKWKLQGNTVEKSRKKKRLVVNTKDKTGT